MRQGFCFTKQNFYYNVCPRSMSDPSKPKGKRGATLVSIDLKTSEFKQDLQTLASKSRNADGSIMNLAEYIRYLLASARKQETVLRISVEEISDLA